MSSREKLRRGGGSQRPAISNQACRQFRAGKCTFGSRCRFSHDTSASSNPSSGRAQGSRAREPDDDRVLRFKRLVTGRTYGSGTSEQNLFSLGVDILTNVKGADAQQQIITLLASEDGLFCIRQVVESRISRAMVVGTTFARKRVWETDMRPLFRLITFESVILSNILEEKVATIYNFIAGVGGARLPAWFDLAKGLAEARDLPPAIPSIEIVELCLAVISKMMDCNTSHVSNPLLREYATSFIGLASAFDETTAESKMSKIQAMEYAGFISRRLETGVSGGGIENLHQGLNNLSLNLHRDLPGTLSGDGPRHDNDHDDITKICILPTQDEIASDRTEYLPTVDPTLWHRPGIAGRLDREFRLLREDTIGQLRNVVRTELDNLQQRSNQGGQGLGKDPQAHPSLRQPKDTIQYCTYHDTSISEAGFDRRTGPEFVFRFRQPAQRSGPGSLRKGNVNLNNKKQEAKSLAQRRDWWMVRAKKRLQPGGLVCVVDSRGSSHFMIVADSTQRFTGDTQQRQNGRSPFGKADENAEKDDFTLADDPIWSFVRLRMPPDGDKDQLEDILRQLFFKTKMRSHSHSGTWIRENEPECMLVEFPGILLDSFLHTLQALQTATAKLHVPFAELLQPSKNDLLDTTEDGMAGIPPPKYAQKPGFKFDLSCLSTEGTKQASLFSHSVDAPISAEEVEKQSRLDMTQSEALVCALSRSVALVQGPPGTGKTFAGVEILKVLLRNRRRAKLGPILIVCYTNHALDQLLEHVLDANVGTQVIRMGSRSKSARLQELSLYNSSRNEMRTRSERSTLFQEGTQLDKLTLDFKTLSSKLGRSMSFDSIYFFLQKHYGSYFIQLFPGSGIDGAESNSDGFTTVKQRRDKVFLKWMRGDGSTRNDDTPQPTPKEQETVPEIRKRLQYLKETSDLNLFSLSVNERNVMYQMWQEESFSLTAAEICQDYGEFVSKKQSYDQVKRETDLRSLQKADIVGVTTTGLARNLHILKNLGSKVLLCEEAGEVLEAHMLSSLIPSLEHLILIGDHQQLRPQVQNYDLRSDSSKGAQYSFDMSLFERLVSPLTDDGIRLPFSQLFTQRRMSPSISDLIRAPLYPNLQDGLNVFGYPDVPGIERRLYWLQHSHLEQGASSGERQADPTSTSRTNLFEVEMTAALVSHLFKQGTYGPGDIAVLTPYLGQMMLLQRRMSSMFEITFNERDEADMETAVAVHAGETDKTTDSTKTPAITRMTLSNSVRIATVDNFQGEEAKVVVISMVRSNEQQRCGFLSTSNRINVLLSRAKHGMYIIGNSDTCSRVPMWKQVIANLEEGGNIGPTLPLRCSRHPERSFDASLPQHFSQFAPDGGCLEQCLKPLPCNHICTKPCHADAIHAAVKCMDPCMRPQKGCNHACPRACSDTCPPKCSTAMPDVELKLECGHSFENPVCWQVQHPKSVKCLVNVRRIVPGCAHIVTVQCGVTDVKAAKYRCRAPCGSTLKCGHACSRPCVECKERSDGVIKKENHSSCRRPCGQPHETCEHACLAPCHADTIGGQSGCPPCSAPCSSRCSHSRCALQCGEQCIPCKEKDCSSHCPHSSCTLPCAVPCDWIPCSKRCDQYLACGHQCPSLCGEECPDERFCHACADSMVLDQQVCSTHGTTYGNVDLDEDPCIFLSCGHIVSTSSMDSVMDMKSHYEMETGHPQRLTSVKTTPGWYGTMREDITCTHCHVPVHGITRYNRVVKQRKQQRLVQKVTMRHKKTILDLVDGLQAIMNSLVAHQSLARGTGRSVDGAKPSSMLKLGKKATCTTLIGDLLGTDDTRYAPFLEFRRYVRRSVSKMRSDENDYHGTFAASDGHKVDVPSTAVKMSGHLQSKLLLLWCDIFALNDLCGFIVNNTTIHDKSLTGVDKSCETWLRKLCSMFTDDKFAIISQTCDRAIAEASEASNVRLELEARVASSTFHLIFFRISYLLLRQPWCSYSDDDGPLERERKVSALRDAVAVAFKSHRDKRWLEAGMCSKIMRENPTLGVVDIENGTELIRGAYGLPNHEMTQPFACSIAWPSDIAAAYKTIHGASKGVSGRWYICTNRHPFQTKEDTLSRAETVRCPECMEPAES